mmetsp:Transcript_7922/g.11928  ORF Transcript_7922/g.11928 Transcript_7922/m.11928 type:complete len:2546 (+) Transcript_7922:104-7741(+)
MDIKSVAKYEREIPALALAMHELANKSKDQRAAAAERIRAHMEKQSRELSAAQFEELSGRLTGMIIDLVNGSDVYGTIGAIQIIELMTEQLSAREKMIVRITTCFRRLFERSNEHNVLESASRVLAQLLRHGSGLCVEIVNDEVANAFQWLQDTKHTERRLAAVLLLKEIARNTPTQFNIHVQNFLKHIWAALSDRVQIVRFKAREALSACMEDIGKRKHRWRVQCYMGIYQTAKDGLIKTERSARAHGSLLAMGELLEKGKEFMVGKFDQVAEFILRVCNSRSSIVHQTTITLLPSIAALKPSRFARKYLRKTLEVIIHDLKNGLNYPICFMALGNMAKTVGKEIIPYLKVIMELIQDALQQRKTQASESALMCFSKIVQAPVAEIEEYADDLIEIIFVNCVLSRRMVDALSHLVKTCPNKLIMVQDKLLLLVAGILSPRFKKSLQVPDEKSIYTSPTSLTLSASKSASPLLHPASPISVLASMQNKQTLTGFSLGPSIVDLQEAGLYTELSSINFQTVVIALQTLGSFNFSNLKEMTLLRFASYTVLPFLFKEKAILRREAALALCKLILSMPESIGKRRHTASMTFYILKQIATLAISDPDANIRYSMLCAMREPLDKYSCQVEILSIIVATLNDEVLRNRKEAISLLGRLYRHNPGYVLPPLRKVLMQLLSELQQFRGNSDEQEESANLLGHLLVSCPAIIRPFVVPIANLLVSKLEGIDGLSRTRTTSSRMSRLSWGAGGYIISAIGQLASIATNDFTIYLDKLMPIIIEALQDETISSAKRMVAVRTIGQLVQGTAYGFQPYEKYPSLLPAVLAAIQKEHQWSTRKEVIKTLGILGARDPILFREAEKLVCFKRNATPSENGLGERQSVRTPDIATEHFYATQGISALLEILKNSQQRHHHYMVIQAVMFIFQSLGPKCVSFLPQTIPLFIQVIENSDPNSREAYFGQLNALVRIVKSQISQFNEEIVKLIARFWKEKFQESILNLLEDLSFALGEKLNEHLPYLVPNILDILRTITTHSPRKSVRLLQTIEILARNGNLNTFFASIISSLTSIFEQPKASRKVIEKVIGVLKILCASKQVSDCANRILHPFSRLVTRVPSVQEHVMDAVCTLISTLGISFLTYASLVTTIVKNSREIREKLVLHKYRVTVSILLRQLESQRKENLLMSGVKVVNNDSFLDEINAITQGLDAVVRPGKFVSFRYAEWKKSMNGTRNGGYDKKRSSGSNSSGDRKSPNADRKQHTLKINQDNLRQAWNATKRHRREDWKAWIRGFAIELLKESPSPALRACSELARKYRPLARKLFNPAFVSCWIALDDKEQDQLVYHLELAFKAVNIPPNVVQLLLNLVEFMEKQDKSLLINDRLLADLAERFHTYAKALHYRELEFQTSPTSAIEQLISINNHLQEPQSAQGLLKYARLHHSREVKTSWYEKLEHWNDALEEYEVKQLRNPNSVHLKFARARCLHALGEWGRLLVICKKLWDDSTSDIKSSIAPLGATAAWNLGEWQWFDKLVDKMDASEGDGAFFWAIRAVHNNEFESAKRFIDRAKQGLDVELKALLSESYVRSYRVIVKVQQLAELEEVVNYKKAAIENRVSAMANIQKMWSRRLQGVQKKVEVWQQILSVRRLVMSPREDVDTWSRYANLCRKSDRLELSGRVLHSLLGYDPLVLATNPRQTLPIEQPQVTMACLSHLWAAGYQHEALERLTQLLSSRFFEKTIPHEGKKTEIEIRIARLQSRCYLKMGQWEYSLFEAATEAQPSTNIEYAKIVKRVINFYQMATVCDPKNQRAWHAWALMNYQVITHFKKKGRPELAHEHIVPAIQGFFKSIQLQRKGQRLQDILRLLQLWFEHGSRPPVHRALVLRFDSISIDVWLDVIPQIIARIQTPDAQNRKLILELLCRIGKAHPQALIYPLAVAAKSTSKRRKKAADSIFDNMRQHYPRLVDQSLVVSRELIRVAILWHEQWQEAIEEASRLWFGEKSFHQMYYQALLPLHKKLMEGPTTIREQKFSRVYGQALQMAFESCKAYSVDRRPEDINRAWDYYSTVFRKLSKEVQKMSELELSEVSPRLLSAKDMLPAVPGTYTVAGPVVKIAGFEPTLKVIDSKQHPRKLKILGSDGKSYSFLLKGHEDLRQDERVMQLFGLINSFLAQDRITAQRDLSIRRYAVIPLSTQSGLIEWVPHCDTIHLLIKEYRDRQRILLNIEHRIMAQMAPDYETLLLIQKIEVFQRALADTKGEDLAKVFRLHSADAESWLARRSNYTRSLAVMSMVGYVLGLGDRHPCNLMISRGTGKIVHIDFGDCFEVAMHREKFPEKIPFRLTRMLINTMEVSGIEGIFRFTCEAVMRVLRDNKESVMAVLEAFVYDPLINWRLIDTRKKQKDSKENLAKSSSSSDDDDESDERHSENKGDIKQSTANNRGGVPTRGGLTIKQHLRSSIHSNGQRSQRNSRFAPRLSRTDDGNSISAPYKGSIIRALLGQEDRILNKKAVRVISRVENKLTGRDFNVSSERNVTDIQTQVQSLILQATSHENLCQCYIGWCPFW